MSGSSGSDSDDYSMDELKSLEVDGAQSLTKNGQHVVQETSVTGMQVYDSPNNIGPDKRQKRKSPARIPGYTSYEKRRLSFERKGWNQPNAPPPAKLAKAGFYCKGSGDLVRCYMCGGTIVKWSRDDEPMEEHRKIFGMDCI